MYRTIDAKFWHDSKIKKLSKDARYLMLYLVTNPHSHLSGLYYLPSVLASHETGISDTLLDTLWHTLSGAGLASFDSKNEVVFVVNMLGYQGKGAKNETAAASQLQLFIDSPLASKFIERYPQFADRVSHRVSGARTQEQEQEQDINTVGTNVPTVSSESAAPTTKRDEKPSTPFLEFPTVGKTQCWYLTDEH